MNANKLETLINLSTATLPEFSDWLFSLAEAIVAIASTSEKEKCKVSRVNLHGASESKTEKQHIELKCCGGNGYFVAQCEKCKTMEYEEKLQISQREWY